MGLKASKQARHHPEDMENRRANRKIQQVLLSVLSAAQKAEVKNKLRR